MELTARMRAILSALLAADGYVPAERIASALDLSARTITREMHGLEMALMPYGIALLRRTGGTSLIPRVSGWSSISRLPCGVCSSTMRL